jgi:hypothetical protein
MARGREYGLERWQGLLWLGLFATFVAKTKVVSSRGNERTKVVKITQNLS